MTLPTFQNRHGRYLHTAAGLYVFLGIVSGFGLMGKLYLLPQLISVPKPLLFAAFFLWLGLPLAFGIALRFRVLLAICVALGVVVASLLIYPRMQQLQRSGRGSDQPDCIIVAARGFSAGHWPYDRAQMWSHTPMSCGPGWVLLQTAPVHLVGYKWNLLLLWLASVVLLRLRLSWYQIAGFFTLLGLCIAVWVAASDGTDFLTFGLVLTGIYVNVREDPQARSRRFVVLALLALVVQFRFPMLILPVLMLSRRYLGQSILTSLLAYAVQLFFLIWRPAAFIVDGPLHLFQKLTHTSVLTSSRWPAVLEITLVFGCMLCVAIYVRARSTSGWLPLIYLLLLVIFPSIQDLAAKYHRYGALLPAFGLWEGANWIAGCLPLAALFLLTQDGERNDPAAPFGLGAEPLEAARNGGPQARAVCDRGAIS